MIDVIGQAPTQVAQRVFRQRRQMNNGFKTLQVGPGALANILADLGNCRISRTEIATREEIGVETSYFVPSFPQHAAAYHTNIALMTRSEHAHAATVQFGFLPQPTMQGPERERVNSG